MVDIFASLYDEVKHKKNDTTGRVIAKYMMNTIQHPNGIQVFDVRSTEDRIYYATPAMNWTVTHAHEEGD